RPHVWALYAFVRTADDYSDEPQYAGRRADELDRWDDLLHRCFHGEAEHPVFIALSATIEKYDLPITPFSDLLSALPLDLPAASSAARAGSRPRPTWPATPRSRRRRWGGSCSTSSACAPPSATVPPTSSRPRCRGRASGRTSAAPSRATASTCRRRTCATSA